MLDPNYVPEQEPVIRVGIVLPEDDFQKLSIHKPKLPEYKLVGNGEARVLESGVGIEFVISGRGVNVSVGGNEIGEGNTWRLEPPSEEVPFGCRTGICVHDVIAGRGFHWKKHLDVFLPGIVEIRTVGDCFLVINELPFEQYVACVATSEMSAECPAALVESQTIAARSWMLANVEMKHKALGFDVCNDDCCQRYQGTTYLTDHAIEGAEHTRGQVLMHEGRICDARYSKCCGGVTEAFEHVWGGKPIPYLGSKKDMPGTSGRKVHSLNSEEAARRWIENFPEAYCGPKFVSEENMHRYLGSVDEQGEYFRWKVDLNQVELSSLLNEKCSLDAKEVLALRSLERGASGRITRLAVDSIGSDGEVYTHELKSEYRIRECLHEKFLFSSAFIVGDKPGSNQVPEFFTLKGAGWGHGVGYCQMGALGMALTGKSMQEILKQYFDDVIVKGLYK